VTFLLG